MVPDSISSPAENPPVIDWPVRTERLSLRPYEPNDLDALWAFEKLPEVQHWLGWAPRSSEELDEAMNSGPGAPGTTHVMVVLDGVVIGHVMIMRRHGWAQKDVAELAKDCEVELGWMFDPAFGGRGYATEAIRAALSLCFGVLGVRRVFAGCFADNTSSLRLMERIGMRREQHNRSSHLHRDGSWHDGLTYALLRDEWAHREGGAGPAVLRG